MTAANVINVSNPGIISANSGAFSSSALTQYNILAAGSGQSVVNIAPSTAGGILISNAASGNASFVVPTATGGFSLTTNSTTMSYAVNAGWVLIQTQTASSGTAIAFTTGISSTYNNYAVVITNARLAAANGILCQLSNNGGMSYLATGYTSGGVSTNVTTGLYVGAGAGSSGEAASLSYLFNLTSGSGYVVSFGISDASGGGINFQRGSYNTAISGVNALNFVVVASTITTMTISLYGII